MPGPLRTAFRLSAFAAAGLLVAALSAVLFRKAIVADYVASYLAGEVTLANVEITRWGDNVIVAHVTLGDPAKPGFESRALELQLDPNSWLPHIESVRVMQSQLRVSFDGQHLSFGGLQKLIDSFSKGPRSEWSKRFVRDPLPVEIDDTRITVDTPAGPLEIALRARLVGAQAQSLQASLTPSVLQFRDAVLHLDRAGIDGQWNGTSFDAKGSLSAHGTVRAAGRVRPIALDATMALEGLAWRYLPSGPDAALRLARVEVHATNGFAGLAIAEPRLALDVSNLNGREENGHWSAVANIDGTLSAQDAKFGNFPFVPLRIDAKGTGRLDPDGTIALDAAVTGNGAMPDKDATALAQAIPFFGDDSRNVAALVRAAHTFSASGEINVVRSRDAYSVTVEKPVTIDSGSGAHATIAPLPASALLKIEPAGAAGSGSVKIGGGGLPSVDLALQNLTLTREGNSSRLDAHITTTSTATTAMLRNMSVSGTADLRGRGGDLTVALDGCANVRLGAMLRRGKPVIADAAARLCPAPGQPLFFLKPASWQLRAALAQASARIVDADEKLSGASAQVAIDGASGALRTGSVKLQSGRLSDLRPEPRIGALTVSGNANYSGTAWRGAGTFGTVAHGARVGAFTFSQDTKSGRGAADIEARAIRFAPAGLAPADLSPSLAAISRADGTVQFTGHLAWTASGMKSNGRLDVDGLKFASPLGKAQGTVVHIAFSSLVPLKTASGQALDIDRIDWMSPFTGVALRFRLAPDAVELSGAKATLAGGDVSIDPLTMSLDPNAKWSGVLRLSGLDLGALLDASNLAKQVHVTANISGTIPMSVGPEGVRFADGSIAATKPGRISIERSLWTGSTILSSNTMQDFAIQALENFAFTSLTGRVNSLPQGRLGIVLHIQGYSDPPNQGETRIGIFDLLGGKAFDKPMPLPKGTPIDLTLDTSLNFDELLRAYRAAQSPTIGVPAK